MASIDLIRASNGSGDAVKATVANARVISSTTLQVSSTTNFPSNFIATVGDVDGTGAFVPATVTVLVGHLSGGNIEIDSFAPGYTDIGNTPDQIVVLKPTTAWANEMADVLAVTHNQDGTLKNKVATLSKINGGSTDGVLLTDSSGNVTGGKVTADKLDWTSINLGYSSGATSQTISTTDTNITGVSTTITSTGLRVRLEAVLNFVISSNAWGIVSIYEGSTLIKQATAYSNGANTTATVVAYITPTAGSHTYTLRARTNAGSMTTHSDSAGREAFLAVSVA